MQLLGSNAYGPMMSHSFHLPTTVGASVKVVASRRLVFHCETVAPSDEILMKLAPFAASLICFRRLQLERMSTSGTLIGTSWAECMN